jgi:predicted membrane channel-forming protein YqfA (hemolysin III family)
VNALIARNIQVGVKGRPLSIVALLVFAGAFGTLLYLAATEENQSVRTMLYILSAFSFMGVLGQISILRTWLVRRVAQKRKP